MLGGFSLLQQWKSDCLFTIESFKVFHYFFAIMDKSPEENIRSEIADIQRIPYGDRTAEDKRRLNALDAEIRRRHPELQSGESPAGFLICSCNLLLHCYQL